MGTTGATGATGSQGASGVPRKISITRTSYYTGVVYGNQLNYFTTGYFLPWTPDTGGVVVNFRGFYTTIWPAEAWITNVQVSGSYVTISGVTEAATSGTYWGNVYFDVVAYDALTQVILKDETSPNQKLPPSQMGLSNPIP
jgi:hypothetical protein